MCRQKILPGTKDNASAITSDGMLWTWGCNAFRGLGYHTNTIADQKTPYPALDNVAKVCLGGGHSAAIKEDGSLWMWGSNKNGQLGDGTTKPSEVPICTIGENAGSSYSIIYDSKGGIPKKATYTISMNGIVVEPEPPTKEGYVFSGWFEYDIDGSKKPFEFGNTVYNNLVLYAKWSAPEEWYERYLYYLDDDNNAIVLQRYLGNETDILVRSTVTIGTKVYNTVLSGDIYRDRSRIKSVEFEEGCSALDLAGIFSGCTGITDLDLSKLDTSKCTRMTRMFYNCSSLETINLDKFDTSSVEYMEHVFCSCDSLLSLDLSSFNTEKVKNMNGMFQGCKSLKSVVISSFITTNVNNMDDMFFECRNLKSLDLSSFQTPKLQHIDRFLSFCDMLEDVDLSSFETSSACSMKNMFTGCISLKKLDLSSFDISTAIESDCIDYFLDYCPSIQVLDAPYKVTTQLSLPTKIVSGNRFCIDYYLDDDKDGSPDSSMVYHEMVVSDISHRFIVDPESKNPDDDPNNPDNPENPDNSDNPDNPNNQESTKPVITVSDNQPMDYAVEDRGGFKIAYNHSIPFYGKAKPAPEFFGEMTVSYNNATYKVSKIKVNKKKKTIQITGLSGVDKPVNKEIKKATKGSSALQFSINPYYVRNDDPVDVKLKKDGSVKSVSITLKGKKYKAKKNGEWQFDTSTKLVIFSGSNLTGSYQVK